MQAVNPLGDIRIFRPLPPEALQRLVRAAGISELRSGTQIFAQGDEADAVYAIVGGEGRVRIGAADRRSKSLMFGVFRTGDLFGEIAVLEGTTRTADAVVEGRVRLARIPAATFVGILREFPAASLELCRVLAERLRWTSILVQDATFESLEARLARQLLYLGELAGSRTEQGLRLSGHFRQSDLADLLGATTRSIINILNAWRRNQVVGFHAPTGRLVILDEASLRDLVEPKFRAP